MNEVDVFIAEGEENQLSEILGFVPELQPALVAEVEVTDEQLEQLRVAFGGVRPTKKGQK